MIDSLNASGSDLNSVLVVSAHAADFCSRAGGTIAKHVDRGHNVWILCLSFGERGESMPLWSDRKKISVATVKEIRKKEAEKASLILGAKIKFMDFDDNPLILNKDRVMALTKEIKTIQPDIVITHYSVDSCLREPMNPDHQLTGGSVVRACYYATCPGALPEEEPHYFPAIYMYEPTVPLTEFTGFVPNVYIDISQVMQKKMEALEMFKKGQPNLPKYYSLYGSFRAWQAKEFLRNKESVSYAEAFYRYTPWLGNALIP